MPLVNWNGNTILERTRTVEEEYLAKLEYWRDENAVWDLSSRQFRMWLYGLDPKEAMRLACNRSFKLLMAMKRNKWNFIWSLIWE